MRKEMMDSDEEPSPLSIEKVLKASKSNRTGERWTKEEEGSDIRSQPQSRVLELATNNSKRKVPVAMRNEVKQTSTVDVADFDSPRGDEDLDLMNFEDVEEIGHYPNPSVTLKGKRDLNDLGYVHSTSPRGDEDRHRLVSQKSLGMLSDTSVKPRKGDKTPKSHRSEIREHRENKDTKDNRDGLDEIDYIEHLEQHYDGHEDNADPEIDRIEQIEDIEQKVKLREKSIIDNELSQINPIPQQLLKQPEMASQPTKTLMTQTEKNWGQYDVQQLSYDLVKEYSHLKIDKDETFMRRMLFDVFKRQTKEERMHKLIERNKVKIDENERIKTFNRLIEDANRRLEAQEKMEKMKDSLEENAVTAKKYKTEEWEEIYEERFHKYQVDKEKKVLEKTKEKIIKDKEAEDQIVESNKAKKVPSHVINGIAKRMYEEAERRKLKIEEMRRKEGIEDEDIDQSVRENDRDLTPSKFKKFKTTTKYNFQSDYSGNEKSDNEDERTGNNRLNLVSKKSLASSLQKNTKENFSNSNSNNKTKSKVNTLSNSGTFGNNKTNKQLSNKSKAMTTTDFNNKRFDKKEAQGIIIEEHEMKPQPSTQPNYYTNRQPTKYRTQKVNESETYFNKLKKEAYFEEEIERVIPQPIISPNKQKVKLNDFKNIKTLTPNQTNHNHPLHIPDFVATKLVDDILNAKLNVIDLDQ